MTEEIKEILKYIDQFVYVDQTYNDIKLSKIDTKLILDYITNLQKENEKLKYNARGQVNDYFKDKYADEVLKNAKLKKENEILRKNAEHNDKVVDKARWNEMIYKSRCKKANKLLKTIYKALPGTYNQLLIEIDNYLQGSDDK